MSVRNLPIRCFIAECDNLEKPVFDEPWAHHAVPGSTVNGIFNPEPCLKFAFEMTSNISAPTDECPAEWFSEKQVACDSWVFDPKERTIVNDVNTIQINYPLALLNIISLSGKLHAQRICGC